MDGTPNNVIELVCRSLAASARAGAVTCVPTLLIERPHGLLSWSSTNVSTSSDLALAYYCSQGFLGDRTRMNLYGYPGLLRDLSNPPPWIEVEMEDVDGDISAERANELRSLVVQAQEHDEEWLVARYRSEQQYKSSVLERFMGRPTASLVTETGADSFRELITLAKVLGVDLFDALYEAVFEFDEFTVAAGAPNLLVWLPRYEPSCWFFSEVKAPGDSLRMSQKGWLHQHWDLVRGHYLITVLE
jgi:hypothetical protein